MRPAVRILEIQAQCATQLGCWKSRHSAPRRLDLETQAHRASRLEFENQARRVSQFGRHDNPGASRLKVGFGNSGRIAPQSWIWKFRARRTSKLDLEGPGASHLKVGFRESGRIAPRSWIGRSGRVAPQSWIGRSGRIAPESWIWKIRAHRA